MKMLLNCLLEIKVILKDKGKLEKKKDRKWPINQELNFQKLVLRMLLMWKKHLLLWLMKLKEEFKKKMMLLLLEDLNN